MLRCREKKNGKYRRPQSKLIALQRKTFLRMLKPGVLVAKTETVDSNLKTCFLTTALLMLLSQARCVPQSKIPPYSNPLSNYLTGIPDHISQSWRKVKRVWRG